MKKITFLWLCIMASVTLNGQTIVVTTNEMNPEVEGSLLHELLKAKSGAIIEFKTDNDTLNLQSVPALPLDNQTLTINGLNMKTGNKMVFKGGNRMIELKNGSDLTLNDLVVRDFPSIAFTLMGNSKVKAANCEFINNREPIAKKVNNGGVFRINGSTGLFNKCVFTQNRCAGSYGGGAICAYGEANLRVENCSFYHNDASAGSAIAINGTAKKASPRVYIANCTFANNFADGRGGAIYMQTAATDVFTPSIVNCTLVGNYTSTGGGAAVCLWSRTSTSMKPNIINNLFAQNYQLPWGEKEVRYDVLLFYGPGGKDPQTIFPIAKNNIYEGASTGTFTDESNRKINFADVNIFQNTELNPWEDGDPTFNHQTSVLSGPMKVALLSKNSIALNGGTASVEGVEIPATDALGNNRPATPSIGAVELEATLGIETMENAASQPAVLAIGKRIYVPGLKEPAALQIFDMSGRNMMKAAILPNGYAELNVAPGIYLVKVNSKATKILIK